MWNLNPKALNPKALNPKPLTGRQEPLSHPTCGGSARRRGTQPARHISPATCGLGPIPLLASVLKSTLCSAQKYPM